MPIEVSDLIIIEHSTIYFFIQTHICLLLYSSLTAQVDSRVSLGLSTKVLKEMYEALWRFLVGSWSDCKRFLENFCEFIWRLNYLCKQNKLMKILA